MSLKKPPNPKTVSLHQIFKNRFPKKEILTLISSERFRFSPVFSLPLLKILGKSSEKRTLLKLTEKNLHPLVKNFIELRLNKEIEMSKV